MSVTPAFLRGPWRAVPVLGLTQIIAWSTLFYPPVLIVPQIAAERGWSLAFGMSGLSCGLLAGGFAAPSVGRLVDRVGGHVVMTAGSIAGAVSLAALTIAASPAAYLAAWVVAGLAMACSLYEPAFASLGRIFGAAARRPITIVTFAGGFASTVSWPLTHLLQDTIGWRGVYLVYAVVLLLIAAPLHAFALPRSVAARNPPPSDPRAAAAVHFAPRGWPLALVALGFGLYAFVPSALASHMLAIFTRAGIDAGTAVLVGALFGPAQVLARLGEYAVAGDTHPVLIVRFAIGLIVLGFALLAMFGISPAVALAFAVLFGVGNGLATLARGTVPLVLFGASGYGRLVGIVGRPFMMMQAAAPLTLALVAERASDTAALGLIACFALASLGCFTMLRRPV